LSRPEHQGPPPVSSGHTWRLSLILLALAAGIRLYRLDQGFWYDEIWALKFFHMSWYEQLTRMPLPNHHPLYSLPAKACILVLGEKEWTARLPAFICGSLTPPLLFMMGSRWVSERAGLMAGLFMSVAAEPVWYSQDARGYAGAIFFSLAATHLFAGLAKEFSGRRCALYVLAGAAAMYSHLYTGAVVAAHLLIAAYLAGRSRGAKKEVLLAAAAMATLVAAFLLYAPMLHDLIAYTRTAGQKTAGRALDPAFIAELLVGWSAGRSHPWLSLPLIAGAAAGIYPLGRRSGIVGAAWLLSLGLAVLAPWVLGTFVYARFYSFAMPGFYLSLAAGLDQARARLKWPRAAGALAAGAAAVLLITGLVPYYLYGKQGLRPAAEWVRHNAPGRRVLAAGMIGEVFGYYMPPARAVPRDLKLTAAMLDHAAVVTSYESTVGEEQKKVMERLCATAAVFPSAGDPQLEVKVYLCSPP